MNQIGAEGSSEYPQHAKHWLETLPIARAGSVSQSGVKGRMIPGIRRNANLGNATMTTDHTVNNNRCRQVYSGHKIIVFKYINAAVHIFLTAKSDAGLNFVTIS
jgi:hypothetical protein